MDEKQETQDLEYARQLKEPEWDTLSGKTLDLKKLLAWGLKNATESEDTSTNPSTSHQQPREKIDPKWIDVILGKSDVVRMRECMERLRNVSLANDARLLACDELELLVEDIDNAQDFCRLELLSLLLPCLKFPQPELRVHVFWVMGTMVQNNPKVKKVFLERNVMQVCCGAISDCSEQLQVKSKALYCLSGLLKHNEPGQTYFTTGLKGIDLIGRELKLNTDYIKSSAADITANVTFITKAIHFTASVTFDKTSSVEFVRAVNKNADIINAVVATAQLKPFEGDEYLMVQCYKLISHLISLLSKEKVSTLKQHLSTLQRIHKDCSDLLEIKL